MQRIILAGERLREVGVAFRVRVGVAVRESGIAHHVRPVVVRDPPVRQRVAIRMAYEITGSCASSEITLTSRIAPPAKSIPTPRFHVQLCILPVRNSLPACREDLFYHGLDEELIRRAVRQPVN